MKIFKSNRSSNDGMQFPQSMNTDKFFRNMITFDNGPESCACVMLDDFEPIEDKLFDFELPQDWFTTTERQNSSSSASADEEQRQAPDQQDPSEQEDDLLSILSDCTILDDNDIPKSARREDQQQKQTRKNSQAS